MRSRLGFEDSTRAVITLAPTDFAIAPLRVLGDGIVRLDELDDESRARLSRDGRTLSLWTRTAIVDVDIERWVTTAIHRHERDFASKNAATFAGPVFAYLRDGSEITLCNARGERRTLAAPSFCDGTVLASPDRDDELYVFAPRSLQRLRFDAHTLRVEATYPWTTERSGSGFELRSFAFAPDGRTLYARTDRDVVRLDRDTLLPIEPSTVFDVNAHNGEARAWIDTQTLTAMRMHDDALWVLTTQRWAKAKLLRISLGDRSVTELEAPPDMVLTSMSEVMANGRVLLRGLSGWVAVDTTKLAITAVLRRESPAKSRWTDVARGVDYAIESDGVFTAARCDEAITVASREGVVRRHHLAWNADHIVALSPQHGIERFAADGSAISALDGATAAAASALSPTGRWAIVERDAALYAQSTSAPAHCKLLTRELLSFADNGAFALADDGAVWRWNGRELLDEDGGRITIARKDTRGSLSLSLDGERAALHAGKEIVVVHTRLRSALCRIAPPKRAVAQFAGARSIVVTGADGVRWFDADTGALLQWHKRRFALEVRARPSPDGKLLALVHAGGVIELVVRDDPSASRSFVAAESVQSVAFSPDQTQLVVASSESVLRIFSVEAALASRGDASKRGRR